MTEFSEFTAQTQEASWLVEGLLPNATMCLISAPAGGSLDVTGRWEEFREIYHRHPSCYFQYLPALWFPSNADHQRSVR